MSHDTRYFRIFNRVTGRNKKYIEVEYGNYVTTKQTGQVQTSMHNDNGEPFITTLYKVLFDQDLCDKLISIIKLMNLVHTWIFHKRFYTFFSVTTNRTQLPYHILHWESMHFWFKKVFKIIKENSQEETFSIIIAPYIRTQVHKIATGWIHRKCLAKYWNQGRSLPFMHIMSDINNQKNPGYDIPLQHKTPIKWFFMDIIASIASKRFTKDTNFANYLLIVDSYSRLTRLYVM